MFTTIFSAFPGVHPAIFSPVLGDGQRRFVIASCKALLISLPVCHFCTVTIMINNTRQQTIEFSLRSALVNSEFRETNREAWSYLAHEQTTVPNPELPEDRSRRGSFSIPTPSPLVCRPLPSDLIWRECIALGPYAREKAFSSK